MKLNFLIALIIASLGITGIAVAQGTQGHGTGKRAANMSEADALLDTLMAITAASDSLAQTSGSYAIANLTSDSIASLLPQGNKSLITSWGSTISIGHVQTYSYQVTIPKVPQDVCIRLASKLKQNFHYTKMPDCNKNGPTNVSYIYLANPQ